MCDETRRAQLGHSEAVAAPQRYPKATGGVERSNRLPDGNHCPTEPSDPWSGCSSHCSQEYKPAARSDSSELFFPPSHDLLLDVRSREPSAPESVPCRFVSAREGCLLSPETTAPCSDLDECWSTNDTLYCSYGRISMPHVSVRLTFDLGRLVLHRRGVVTTTTHISDVMDKPWSMTRAVTVWQLLLSRGG